MSVFRDDPKFAHAFDLEDHTLLGLAIRIADLAFEQAEKISAGPCPTWCTLGYHSYRPRQIQGGAVERTHQMEIHEESTESLFDASIMQVEIRHPDGRIELAVPFAKVKANADHVIHPDVLLEYSKTMNLTAENLRRIQE